ncbi:unnamed protein product [Rotaria sp. Silwood2]|nr:unnamed protein product [Rotaria sp. Silwood2]CAF3291908.1 unnamed protein product [Rotaria sp. Silwood2]CAF3889713.1 unnamed protein product [Rotaria sp. Silwood2]CAF4184705.1 unnamed protein product [Rotaria sp. Silwood2]CAF4263991.1 unnamed protein product [Rotaria sp. Silwood2]
MKSNHNYVVLVENVIPLYRYAGGGAYFYTTSVDEIGTIMPGGIGKYQYVFEGVACNIFATLQPNTIPLYRYSANTYSHFYTTNWAEIGTDVPDNFNNNPNYNQSSTSSYGQHGYNLYVSRFNPPISPNSDYSQSLDPIRQNQLPLPMPQQSMVNYDIYKLPLIHSWSASNMPLNNNSNQSSYGPNQQRGFGNNLNNFRGMNNPFNLPPLSSGGSGEYNNVSSTPSPFI